MIRKLKEEPLFIGDEEEYFISIHGFQLLSDINALFVLGNYPDKQASEFIGWVVDFQQYSYKEQPPILDKIAINVIESQEQKFWKVKKVFQHDIHSKHQLQYLITIHFFNERNHLSKISTLLVTSPSPSNQPRKVIIKSLHLFNIKGDLIIEKSGAKLYAIHGSENEEVFGQLLIGEVGSSERDILLDEKCWIKNGSRLQKIPNMDPHIRLMIRQGFLFKKERIIMPVCKKDGEDEQMIEKGIIGIRIANKNSQVESFRKIDGDIYCISQINDQKIGVLLHLPQGYLVEILSLNLTHLTSIWTHGYLPSFSTITMTFNTQQSLFIATQNSKTIIDRNGHKYWSLEKVGGLRYFQVVPLGEKRFIVSCCHAIMVYEPMEEEEDSEFLAM